MKSAMKLARVRTALFLVLTLAVLMGMASRDHDAQPLEAAEHSDASSVKSGNWSDPAVWSDGHVPTSGKSVAINSGHTVEYDVLLDAVLGDVSIHGTLRFSRKTSTRLVTNGNIMVMSGGFLDMGNGSDSIPRNVKAEVVWLLSQAQANAYKGGTHFEPTDKGLWAMSGSRWEVKGAPLLRSWSKLAGDAPAGATSVVVENNVADWHIGGAAVITQTSSPAVPAVDSSGRSTVTYNFENEIRTVTRVEPLSGGKTRVSFNQPLSYLHQGIAPYQGEVGLLSRNVRFETRLQGVSESTLIADVGTRKFAHTMWMNGARGDAQYAEFKFMGNYLKLGRYPIHAHQMEETSDGKMIRGNGIWYTGFRWVNIHTSNGITIEDNVGFSSTQSGYFGEADFYQDPEFPDSNRYILEGANKDLVFVHNLGVEAAAVRFEDRSKGDFARHSTFWVASSAGYAFLGNVAVGTRNGRDTGGYMVGEGSFNSPGTMGEHFLKNESHSNKENGFFHWNNRSGALDLVDSLMWRNGTNGMHLGAYTGEFMAFNSKLHGNTTGGVLSNSIDTFVQDSVITDSPMGWLIGNYFAEQSPKQPHWNVRNSYQNLKTGYSHLHDDCDSSSSEKEVLTRECGADYSYLMGNEFKNVSTPIDFGWQANANAWHRVADSVGMDPALPKNFNINRKDQKSAGNQGPESSAIVGDGSKSTSNASFDALVTPIATPWADYPPQIKLEVTMNGKSAKLKATAADDKGVPKVEFFVDWDKVATMTAPPYETTVDLSNHPRKYAYIYARAFDDTVVFQHQVSSSNGKETNGPYQQRAYSAVKEIGPEFLVTSTGQSAPAELTSITVKPAVATALPGGSVQFSAVGSDQYGNSFPIKPTWKVSGGGSINQSGLLDAGSAVGGPFSVSAAQLLVSGSATLSVKAQPGDPRLAVSNLKVASGKAYQVVDGLSTGSPVYIDRGYTYTGVPVLIRGKTYIRTANDDKNRTEVPAISFSVDRAVRVYVAYDARASALPNWLRDWADTGQTLESTDVSLELYVKDFAAGSVSLGGNMATGAVGPGSNYTLIIGDQDGPIGDVVVIVTDPETLTRIIVDPTSAAALPGGLVQFTATGQDQHGAAFLINPSWVVSGGGSINQSGLLTAGTGGGGPFTVTASQGLVSGTATVSMVVKLVVSDFTVASSQGYQVLEGLKVGDLVYIDRAYTYSSVPAPIQGATYLQTANIDKNRTEPSFLAFSVNRAVTVYVAYDSRATALPAWMAGWSSTGSTLNNTDVLLDLYAKEFAAGPITLGANLAAGAAGADSNYSVAIVPM